jgi:ferric-dicitrate binding protein FerR (iron transport regulator)
VLRGPLPTGTAGGARAAAASAKQPPRVLWGRDDHGRFRTRGSNSVATVRGTSWYVADRCDGTLTRVTRGSVSVRDLRGDRTVVVRAGQSYLARGQR